MHPYLLEQQIKARNENLRRAVRHPRPGAVWRWPRVRPSLRHQLGWMLVGVGLRMALGRPGSRGSAAARRGSGPAITHG